MNELNFQRFGISKDILKSLSKLDYEKPSKVQKKVIPIALKNKDIIVKSKTGSGKTAAFAIPICENITIEENKPQALILTPTRELCVQVKEDVKNIGRFKKIRAVAVFGKQPFRIQSRELKQRVHVVVGTPGRTLDHIERGNLEVDEIKYLIIDEADEMLNMGFIEQVESVINNLPKNRVTMLFSATISEEIEKLCNKYMINPITIEVNPEKITEEKIEHIYYEVPEEKKSRFLNKVVITENPDSCIIFCRTKKNVDEVFNYLKSKKYPCNKLHGGMMQNDRLEVMQEFKRGKFIYLVATDVAARGIDVENITHVINYDIPLERESYVHRTGRTGRAGKKGKAISFVTPYEYNFWDEIEEYIGFKIPKGEEIKEQYVQDSLEDFNKKIKSSLKPKKIKCDELNKDITKIYINAGKKKKIRPGDIVGGITSIPGIVAENIGIIDIQDNFSYIDILDGKGKIVLDGLKKSTIKGKKVRAEKADK
ncbi:ATP-dependent RNA helicase DbpA [Clostridium acetireducens DSM 10703]|jgi:ATP-dependent RNA helicase DeaD|uniref:ATP-dependent RNA helicase DbpA n=1 Tax=Clostridium acetireducens DSM 10703 TaxID=1121290 RepID=A0A1E8EXK9_9CLOT|nr:DEAD/DEAH box helicase [Clostridium acetireducens]OFI05526.1 ATP-dependent RNA helicase DbpA [Clostridium acetireducens DSM 10703]